MDALPAWVAILATLLGGGVGAWILKVIQMYNDKDKLKTQHADAVRIRENEQAFKIYKDLLDNLRKDIAKISEDANKIEAAHLACREENATLRAEKRSLEKELEALRASVKGTV